MKYVALKDFNGFKKGDDVPAEFVEQRLIRSKKIGIVYSDSVEIVKQIKEELITEVAEVQEKEEILLEDSSAVEVIIKEEIVKEVPEETKGSKKSKK